VGVGAVILEKGRVLLVRRARDPLQGRWVVPGGRVEWGETLEEAIVREVREETGLDVRPTEMLGVVDAIDRALGEVRFHHVIVDYLCVLEGGTLCAGSDALEAAFAAPAELSAYDVPEKAQEVIREGLRRGRLPSGAGGA
jgi:8-oxo-dGTP diphosphatase